MRSRACLLLLWCWGTPTPLASISWRLWDLHQLTSFKQPYPFTTKLKITNYTHEPAFVITRNPAGLAEAYPQVIEPRSSINYEITLISREIAPYQLIMIGFSESHLLFFADNFISTRSSLELLSRLDTSPIAIIKPHRTSRPRKSATVSLLDFDLNDHEHAWRITY